MGKSALLLADSLLKNTEAECRAFFKKEYDLDNFDFKSFPGKTTKELIGPYGEFHKLNNDYDLLFLVSGANDFNRNHDSDHFRKCRAVCDEIHALLHAFSLRYPGTNTVFAPIPMRQICELPSMKERFPESGSPAWINTTNKAMSLFQSRFKVCACHSNMVRVIFSPQLQVWEPFLKQDGLHLTDEGKSFLISHLSPAPSSYFMSDDEFPPLPPGSGFSFEPKVQLPRRVPRMGRVPISPIVTLAKASADPKLASSIPVLPISLVGTLTKAPADPKLVSSTQIFPRISKPAQSRVKPPPSRQRVAKRSERHMDPWLMPLSPVDPKFSFSQPNHLPKVRVKKIRPKTPKPKDESQKVTQPKKKKKVPWYEVEYETKHFLPKSAGLSQDSGSEGESGPSLETFVDGKMFGLQDFGLYGCSQSLSNTAHSSSPGETFHPKLSQETGFDPSTTTMDDSKETQVMNGREQLRTALKQKICILRHTRMSKHNGCIACNYAELSSEPKVSKHYAPLLHGYEILRVTDG